MNSILKAIVVIIVIIGVIVLVNSFTREAAVPVPEDPVESAPSDESAEVTDSPESVEEEVSDTAEIKEFTLDAFNFGFSDDELTVNLGDTVVINLTNSDGFHDWVLDEFAAQTTQIQTGETTSVTFVATERGTFEYYCSVGNHREQGMVGTLVVK